MHMGIYTILNRCKADNCNAIVKRCVCLGASSVAASVGVLRVLASARETNLRSRLEGKHCASTVSLFFSPRNRQLHSISIRLQLSTNPFPSPVGGKRNCGWSCPKCLACVYNCIWHLKTTWATARRTRLGPQLHNDVSPLPCHCGQLCQVFSRHVPAEWTLPAQRAIVMDADLH